jgi:O-antigen ligase
MSCVVYPLRAGSPNDAPPAEVARARPPEQRFSLIYILGVPLLAGIATLRGVEIFGFNYSGFLWVIAFVIGALLLLEHMAQVRPRRIHFPVVLWLPWLGYLGLSFLWLDEITYLQVQAALQLGMPVLVGTLAALFVRSRPQLELLVRTYFFSLWLLVGLVGLCFLGILSSDELDPAFVAVRLLSLTAVVMGGLFMAGVQRKFGRSWLGWALCLTVTVVTGSRMASMAMLMLPILNPVTRRLLLKVVAVAVVGLMGVGIASTSMFQERFFYGGSGDVSDILSGDFDSAGRFDAWPVVLDEALNYPWLGHGVGSVQVFLPTFWPEVVHPHNDYLRLFYELGVIGLALFVGIVGWLLWDLRREVRRTSGVVQQAFGGAWLGLAAFLLIALTDNPIVYHVWYMNPVFALLGAAYAVGREEEYDARRQRPLPTGEAGTQTPDIPTPGK